MRTNPTAINVITPRPRHAIWIAVDKRRRSRFASPYAHDRAPPSFASFPDRTSRRIAHNSAIASAVAAATNTTIPPTKIAPVRKSCDCIITTANTAIVPRMAASTPPAPGAGMSRRSARTGGVLASAMSGGIAKPSKSTRPVVNAFTSGVQPAGGKADANSPRTAHARPAWAAYASATPSKQAISASTKNCPTKCINVCRCPAPSVRNSVAVSSSRFK